MNREQQIAEIRDSRKVVYQSPTMTVTTFDIPRDIQEEINHILETRRKQLKRRWTMLERFALGVITGLVVTVAYLGLRQLDPRVAANVLCVFGGSIISLLIVCLCAVGRRA